MTQREHADQEKRGGTGLERPIDLLENRRASKEEARAAGDLKGQRARSSAERLLTRTTSGAIYAIVTLVCLLMCIFPVAKSL